jgi:uncharacterized protein (TIGR00304 family)
MADLVPTGLLLVFGGIIVIVIALAASARKGEQRVKGGAVILVGPIPIAFGTDAKWASVAIALAIVLVVLSLLFYLA